MMVHPFHDNVMSGEEKFQKSRTIHISVTEVNTSGRGPRG